MTHANTCPRCEDFANDARKVLSERCAPDERHCSCVPHLRAEIGRLIVRGDQHATLADGLRAQVATLIAQLDALTRQGVAVQERLAEARAERDELRLALLAEQGDIKGAPDGWKRTGSMWFRPLGPVNHQVEVRRSTIHPTGEPYHWTLHTPTLSAEGYAPTAREAMKRADKAFQEKA